jgi:hypothetical protein
MIAPISQRLRHFRLNRASPTAKGLVAWWPGAHPGSKSLHDAAGINTGTWSGTGAHWASDGKRQGVVAAFNGVDDCVDLSAVGGWGAFTGRGDWTCSLWCYTTQTSTRQGILADWHAGFAGESLAMQFGGSQVPNDEFGVNLRAASGAHALATGVQYTTNTWYHFAATFDGATARAYIDGQDCGVTVSPTPPMNEGNALYIGRGGLYDGIYLTGRVDDVRAYTRALSAAEIRFIYDCGRVAPLSDLVEPVGRDVVGVAGGVVPWHLFGRVA